MNSKPLRFALLVADTTPGAGSFYLFTGAAEHVSKQTLAALEVPEHLAVIGAVEFNDYGQIHPSSRRADPPDADDHVCRAAEGIACLRCTKVHRALAWLAEDFRQQTGIDLGAPK